MRGLQRGVRVSGRVRVRTGYGEATARPLGGDTSWHIRFLYGAYCENGKQFCWFGRWHNGKNAALVFAVVLIQGSHLRNGLVKFRVFQQLAETNTELQFAEW